MKTNVYLEKSSTRTKMKQLPLRLLILVGPNKSMWINSNGLDIMIFLIALKEALVCFSIWHTSQMRSFQTLNKEYPFEIDVKQFMA